MSFCPQVNERTFRREALESLFSPLPPPSLTSSGTREGCRLQLLPHQVLGMGPGCCPSESWPLATRHFWWQALAGGAAAEGPAGALFLRQVWGGDTGHFFSQLWSVASSILHGGRSRQPCHTGGGWTLTVGLPRDLRVGKNDSRIN